MKDTMTKGYRYKRTMRRPSLLSGAFAALLSLLLPCGCEPSEPSGLADPSAPMRFSVSESVPDLLTKSSVSSQEAARTESSASNVLLLTSADGRTLRLVAEEEPLSVRTSPAAVPETKAVKIYKKPASSSEVALGGDPIAVWAYNIAATASSFQNWRLDGGLPKSGSNAIPVQVEKDGTYWKPTPDIQFNTENLNAYRTRWFALAPWDAYNSTDITLNYIPSSTQTTLTMDYTVPSAINAQWDLLASTSESREIADTDPVDLTFLHVLTGVRFKRDKDLGVQSITVSGVYDKATLDLLKVPATPQPLSSGTAPSLSSFTDVDGTGAATDLWSGRAKSVAEPSWTMDMTSADWTNGHPDTQYDYAGKDANILMMIPQLTPQGAKITVTIGGVPYTGDISGHRWLPGRLVTYYIDNKFFGVTFSGATGATLDATTNQITLSSGIPIALPFSVNTNLGGFTVSVSDPAAVGLSASDLSATVSVKRHDPTRVGFDPGLTKFLPFSVSATKKVYFSPGNLQYRASTGTWRFAEHQWDYVGGTDSNGEDYGTVYEGGVKSDNALISETYDGWIDLFGWGTSGYSGWAANTYGSQTAPWSIDIPDYTNVENPDWRSSYGPITSPARENSLKGIYANGDWGVANAGVLNGQYRVLDCGATYEEYGGEWDYLITQREPVVGQARFLKASLNLGEARTISITFTAKDDLSYYETFTVIQKCAPVNGLILFPDGEVGSAQPHSSAINDSGSSYNNVSKEQWLAYQMKGCVFLPAAGRRDGSTVYPYNQENGLYWSSTSWYSNTATRPQFGPTFVRTSGRDNLATQRHRGLSVRLVRDVE